MPPTDGRRSLPRCGRRSYVLAVEIESVGTATVPSRRPQPIGVTAELAEARKQLRSVAPPDSWDAVMDEVHAVQAKQHVSLLAALHVVYARLAAGWTPGSR